VFVSRRGEERDVRREERVAWRPAGMAGEAVEIEVGGVFRGIP